MNIIHNITVAAFMVVVAMGCSGPHSRHHWDKSPKWKDHVSSKLELTEQQKIGLESLAKAWTNLQRDMEMLRVKQRSQLVELMGKKSLEQESFDKVIHTAQLEFETKFRTVATKLIEFHMTLNTDQKEKLSQMMNESPRRRVWH